MSTVRQPAPHNPGQEKLIMALLAMVLAFVLIWIYLPPVMYGYICVLYFLWGLVDIPQFHAWAAEHINLLAWAGNNVNTLTWDQFVTIINHTAGILFIPLGFIVVFGILVARNHPANCTRRVINVYTLPHIMSSWSPTIIPALCYGDKKTQLLNVDPPEHRSAQHPEEFAVEHQLVVGMRLDRARTAEMFRAQLGQPMTGPEDLNAHERALFTVFALASFMDNRKQAESLLDTLNRSCLFKSRKSKSRRGYPDLDRADTVFRKVLAHPEAAQWFSRYGTARTCLSALHDQDLRLPGARFRWLKGLDRPLWYALTSTGRPKVFIEGAGIIARARWETLVAVMSARLQITVPLPENCMDIAIDALNDDLQSIGMVAEDHDLQPEKKGKSSNTDDMDDDDAGEEDSVVILPTPSLAKAPAPASSPVPAPPESPAPAIPAAQQLPRRRTSN
ncbi:secretion/conjugation apparatus DotM-related subunit [Dryocola clanedunensis]|uniref:secretion/conjugation apparatus DotM-related subunit n=1 Tax=Cedecea sulfonylureivorans TaxID=3051154 RepID=UPI001927F55C|nr:conjugal transfer protein TrbA [Cedecea sulfonylureivorans]